jgi:hypothetical protein
MTRSWTRQSHTSREIAADGYTSSLAKGED